MPFSHTCRLWTTLTVLVAARAVYADGSINYVLPPSQAVAARQQSQWAEAWWQWAYSFSRSSGPVADLTGKECGAGQTGPIWFLAGTYESRPIRRTCTVPSGKYIFFPVINYVGSRRGKLNESEAASCDYAKRMVEELTNPAVVLTVEFDGAAVPNVASYRQVSAECFDLAAAVPGAESVLAAANGYWIMLKPLSPGRHLLKFGAVLPSLQQGVIYDLVVEGELPTL